MSEYQCSVAHMCDGAMIAFFYIFFQIQSIQNFIEFAAPNPLLPANNRIYLDGKPYEVKYIGETPVVERDGLPHRVYFYGQPRQVSSARAAHTPSPVQVFFDNQAHTLPFNDTLTIMVDGTQLQLRFGAPGRELYIGRYPFRGAFGGPPIFATINGVRHEVRIGGPPPEVKIEPEPAHELTRWLHNPHLMPAGTLYTHPLVQPMVGGGYHRSAGILPAPPSAQFVPVSGLCVCKCHSKLFYRTDSRSATIPIRTIAVCGGVNNHWCNARAAHLYACCGACTATADYYCV
jgi:hypothetical protein